ncbi:Glutathione S-transferase D1 [Blattella germanica]|nr:Glutathione S-transferase D1 [Blattella germanica]
MGNLVSNLQMNPQHNIPTLNDNGFCLSESRAICAYLLDRYAKDDSLYPKDPKKRAVVNQRLYFDAGTLCKKCLDYYYGIVWMGKEPEPEKLEIFKEAVKILDKFLEETPWAAGDHLTLADIDLITTISTAENPIIWMGKKPEPEKLEKFKEAVQFLEHFLNGNTWAAGDNLTIADFDLVATVSTVELFDFHLQPYPNVTRWLAKAKKIIPGYEEINHAGCVAYKKRWDEAISKWK